MFGRITEYLNPISRLGKKRSFIFPFLVTVLSYLVMEYSAVSFFTNVNDSGTFILLLSMVLVIYFSLRDGIIGGIVTTILSVTYYFYVIYNRNYSLEEFVYARETIIVLSTVFLFLSFTIGWLKQTIDGLIEREANEKKRLQAIVQQLPVGIVITDSLGRVVQTNKKVEEILGKKIPLGLLIDKDEPLIKNNIKLETKSRIHQSPLRQALSSGKSIVGREYSIKREDGKEITLNVSASAILNRKGKIFAAATIIDDITAQKEIEKRKDDFINIASHELKTPLTSMKLYLELLQPLIKTQGLKESKLIKGIKYQISRLQKLVNDLLDVSRLQTGKLAFEKKEFDLNRFINETVKDLQTANKNKRIQYVNQKPIKIYADKIRIYQVLTNLINNALKYSPENTKIIVKSKKENDLVKVSVQDFGIGISKVQRKKIFDKLYQVKQNSKSSLLGFGMGLYISKEIIRRHHGNIWVESEKGKGSTFYFTLPLHS